MMMPHAVRGRSARRPAFRAGLFAGSGLSLVALLAAPALAQDGPRDTIGSSGDIIVTAQRRAETLQSVPIAITALQGDTLEREGLTDIRGFSKITPSLNVASYPNASSTLTLNMRGQGAGDAGQITKDGGVGLYVDGFYISRPQGALFDVGDPERVEVLRGPQGTLYGRNTTGGAVNIITKKPTGEWGGKASLSGGSRSFLRALASVDLPAFANLSVKGTILYSDKDGWVTNPGGNDYNKHGDLAGRIAVRWQPGDALTVDYAWSHGRVTSTPDYYFNPDMVGVIPGYTGHRDRTSGGLDVPLSKAVYDDHQLTIEWALSDSFTVRSLSSYRNFREDQWVDYSYSFNTMETAMFTPFRMKQFNRYTDKQYSQELQFIGSVGEQLDYTGGLYFFHEKGYHVVEQDTEFTGPLFEALMHKHRAVWAKTTSLAAYAQATWTPPVLNDNLHLTVGARYTHDKKEATRDQAFDGVFTDLGVENSKSFSNFSPSVNIAYDWTPNLMTYAKMAKGYKAGGSSEGGADFRITYGPEKVTSWEAGFKSQFFDRMVTLNVAAFWNEFKDMQLDFVVDPVDTTLSVTQNIGEARVRGVEVDLAIQPARTLTLRGSYSYLDPHIKKVLAPPGTNFDPNINPDSPYQPGDNVGGRFGIPYAPSHAFSITGDWTFFEKDAVSLNIQATYSYEVATLQSAGAGPIVPGRDLYFSDPLNNLDLRLTYELDLGGDRNFALTLFSDNLLNQRSRRFVTAIGSALTGFTTRGEPWNEPRTFGVEARFRF